MFIKKFCLLQKIKMATTGVNFVLPQTIVPTFIELVYNVSDFESMYKNNFRFYFQKIGAAIGINLFFVKYPLTKNY